MMDMVHKHYRALHQIPERAFQEYATSAYIRQNLREMGYVPQNIGETGVYADLCIDPKLPWLLFRADMDALPVTEETGVSYASKTPGMMHACGHDGHTAMLLTAAAKLKNMALPQNVRFVFQCAEEVISGARKMVDGGVIAQNTVAAFGVHLWPKVPEGKLVAKAGALMASSTRLQIDCFGKNAHCSKRREGADALMTAAKIATRFPEAEALADGDGTVLFCGKLQSGTAHNIVSDRAELWGTLRSFDQEKRTLVLNRLDEILAECADQYGTRAIRTEVAYNPAVINPLALAQKVQRLFPEAITDWEPALAAEDFSQYQQEVPGMFMWLGVGDTAPLHNGKFLVPEPVLDVGVDSWLKIANHKW